MSPNGEGKMVYISKPFSKIRQNMVKSKYEEHRTVCSIGFQNRNVDIELEMS